MMFNRNTATMIPKSLLDKSYLLVPESQVSTYSKECKNNIGHILGIPDHMKGIGVARQWAVDNLSSKYLFFLDDDLKLNNRIIISEGKTRTIASEENDKEKCFEYLMSLLIDGAGQVAIGSSWMCNTKPKIIENGMCSMAVGVNADLLRKYDIRYDRLPYLFEDTYVCISLLRKNYKNTIIYDYVIHDSKRNSDGGCSDYRDKELQEKCLDELISIFPKYVTKFYRENKEWPKMGIGVAGSRVSWRKLTQDMGKKFSDRFKLYEIIEGKLYQRGKLTRFDIEKKEKVLTDNRIDIVIGLAGKIDIDLEELNRRNIIDYRYHHITDGLMEEDTKYYILNLAKDLASSINDGKRVLVYCRRGRNRSGLLNALISRELLGLSGKDSLNLIRERRPNSISNDYFVQFLESLP